jgi:toxin-antitoxin system PIN domain toxin
VDEGHVAYKAVRAWLHHSAGKHWATCPLTQAGFVRIISSLQFHEQPISVAQAFELLRAITERPGHRFWPMDITLAEAVKPFRERLFGHRQVTDAYLLGLAIKNKGRLVTLDPGIETLAGEAYRQHVTVLQG